MNKKRYEGLTLEGIEAHIAGAVLFYNKGKGFGTGNDCQLVTNFLVRIHHKRMRDLKMVSIASTEAARRAEQSGDPYHLEHAIPVAETVRALMAQLPHDDLLRAVSMTRDIVRDSAVFAKVTKDEHKGLNKSFADCMPSGFDSYPWRDCWARYRLSNVPVPALEP